MELGLEHKVALAREPKRSVIVAAGIGGLTAAIAQRDAGFQA